VHRALELDPDWHISRSAILQFSLDSPHREQESLALFDERVESLSPDVVFIWHGHGLSRAMFRRAELRKESVTVYFLANYLPEMPDEYLEFWSQPGRRLLARLLKGLLRPAALWRLKRLGRPPKLSFEHTISVSEHVRARLAGAGLIGPDAVTIPNGADLQALEGLHRVRRADGLLRLILGGRISPEKGVHTALEALDKLKQQGQLDGIRFTIIGDGPSNYVQALEKTIQEWGLAGAVQLRSGIPLPDYQRLLSQHDAMLFPSIWDEPMSNTMIEAMALGLLVIGTTTGGSAEILREGQTGLTFPARRSDRLAAQILRVRQQPDLLEALAGQGERFVRRHHTMTRMQEEIEAHLLRLVGE
jgi:glycogen(starch) synthase